MIELIEPDLPPVEPERVRLIGRRNGEEVAEVPARRIVYLGPDLIHGTHSFEAWFSLSTLDQSLDYIGRIGLLHGKTDVAFMFEP